MQSGTALTAALREFQKPYPKVRPDWRFESRQVDLIAEGFDAAIGAPLPHFDIPNLPN